VVRLGVVKFGLVRLGFLWVDLVCLGCFKFGLVWCGREFVTPSHTALWSHHTFVNHFGHVRFGYASFFRNSSVTILSRFSYASLLHHDFVTPLSRLRPAFDKIPWGHIHSFSPPSRVSRLHHVSVTTSSRCIHTSDIPHLISSHSCFRHAFLQRQSRFKHASVAQPSSLSHLRHGTLTSYSCLTRQIHAPATSLSRLSRIILARAMPQCLISRDIHYPLVSVTCQSRHCDTFFSPQSQLSRVSPPPPPPGVCQAQSQEYHVLFTFRSLHFHSSFIPESRLIHDSARSARLHRCSVALL
jgi:hypothetical protein